MVAIGVDEAPSELARERLADGGLAHARNPHHHHDHGRLWTAWPPKRVRNMASSLRAWSERPWLEKRDINAVMITGAGTPSSIDSTAVQRPAPESSTIGAMPERSSFSFRIAAHRSSSQERTTLPWRQVSASRAGSMSSSGRAAMSAKPSALGVAVIAVAAIDQGVAGRKQRQQIADRVLDRAACRQHQNHYPLSAQA